MGRRRSIWFRDKNKNSRDGKKGLAYMLGQRRRKGRRDRRDGEIASCWGEAGIVGTELKDLLE